jgi:hypothetical protein
MQSYIEAKPPRDCAAFSDSRDAVGAAYVRHQLLKLREVFDAFESGQVAFGVGMLEHWRSEFASTCEWVERGAPWPVLRSIAKTRTDDDNRCGGDC